MMKENKRLVDSCLARDSVSTMMSFTLSLRHSSDQSCSEFTCPCKESPLSVSLFTAAQIGDLITVNQRLLRNPALATLQDDYGYSALHYAAQNGHVDIVRLLIEYGAGVDENKCGATPLHRAGRKNLFLFMFTAHGILGLFGIVAYSGHWECCRLLLEAGAMVNAQDSSFGDLSTPAHKAAGQGHFDIVNLLLAKGADMDIKDKANQTVYDVQDEYERNVKKERIIIKLTPSVNNVEKQRGTENDDRRSKLHYKPHDTSSKQSIQSMCPLCQLPCLAFARNKFSGQLVCSQCKYCK